MKHILVGAVLLAMLGTAQAQQKDWSFMGDRERSDFLRQEIIRFDKQQYERFQNLLSTFGAHQTRFNTLQGENETLKRSVALLSQDLAAQKWKFLPYLIGSVAIIGVIAFLLVMFI